MYNRIINLIGNDNTIDSKRLTISDFYASCSYYLNLLDGIENGWDILEKFEFPFEFCRRCAPKEEWYPWEISDMNSICKSDWEVQL